MDNSQTFEGEGWIKVGYWGSRQLDSVSCIWLCPAGDDGRGCCSANQYPYQERRKWEGGGGPMYQMYLLPPLPFCRPNEKDSPWWLWGDSKEDVVWGELATDNFLGFRLWQPVPIVMHPFVETGKLCRCMAYSFRLLVARESHRGWAALVSQRARARRGVGPQPRAIKSSIYF